MTDVFISYSRLDKEFVGQLRDKLTEREQDVWIDWEDIPPSQSWWEEIRKGIAKANNCVLVLSPNSMSSPVCQMEIEYARELKKRIIPVFHLPYDRDAAIKAIQIRLAKPEESTTRDIWGTRNVEALMDANEAELKHINYFFFRPEDDFEAKFDALFTIIRTDYLYKEQHTTLQVRAQEWHKRNRDKGFLLFDNELRDAEAWLANAHTKNPVPTPLHQDYIQTSRTEEDNRIQSIQEREKRIQDLDHAEKASRDSLLQTQKKLRREQIAGSITAAFGGLVIGVSVVLIVLSLNVLRSVQDEVESANSQLAAVPPTLTKVNEQVVAVQAQVDDANTQLTAVPPTLTKVNEQVVAVQAQVDDANTQLTAVPPTLTKVNEQVVAVQAQVDAIAREIVSANIQLTSVAQTVAESEQYIEALRLASESTGIMGNLSQPIELASLLAIRSLNLSYNDLANTTLLESLPLLSIDLQYQGDIGVINDMAISLDNRLVVTGSMFENEVSVWDFASGTLLQKLKGHTEDINGVAISHDSRIIASASSDQTVRLWTASGEPMTVLEGHVSKVNAVAFSADDRYLASGDASGVLHIHDLRDPTSPQWVFFDFPIHKIIFTPNQPLILVLLQNGDVWSLEVGSTTPTLLVQGENSLNTIDFALSPDGNAFTTVDDKVGISVYSMDGDLLLNSFPFGVVPSAITYLNDETIAIASLGQVLWWNYVADETTVYHVGHEGIIWRIANTTDNESIVTAGRDGKLLRWSLNPSYSPLVQDTDVNTALFGNDNQWVIMLANGTLNIWNDVTEDYTLEEEVLGAEEFALSQTGDVILSPVSGGIGVWDLINNESLNYRFTLANDNEYVYAVAINADGTLGISQGANGNLIVWDLTTGEEMRRLVGHTQSASDIALSPDGTIAVSGGFDSQVIVWDVQSGAILQQYEMPSIVSAVALSPDKTKILVGTKSAEIYLLNVANKTLENIYVRHSISVESVVFSPDGTHFVSGGGDSLLIFWDIAKPDPVQVVRMHEGGINSVTYSADGKQVLSGSADGTVRLWNTDYHDLIDTVCSVIYRDLTLQERQKYGIRDNTPTCTRFGTAN